MSFDRESYALHLAIARAERGIHASVSFDPSKHRRAAKGTPGGGQFISSSSNSKGEPVKLVQKQVGMKTTGKWDDKLTEAVKSYQRRRGLLVDGIVGAQTWAAFRGKKADPGALPANVASKLREMTKKRRGKSKSAITTIDQMRTK